MSSRPLPRSTQSTKALPFRCQPAVRREEQNIGTQSKNIVSTKLRRSKAVDHHQHYTTNFLRAISDQQWTQAQRLLSDFRQYIVVDAAGVQPVVDALLHELAEDEPTQLAQQLCALLVAALVPAGVNSKVRLTLVDDDGYGYVITEGDSVALSAFDPTWSPDERLQDAVRALLGLTTRN